MYESPRETSRLAASGPRGSAPPQITKGSIREYGYHCQRYVFVRGDPVLLLRCSARG
jgi:hypothetical protein